MKRALGWLGAVVLLAVAMGAWWVLNRPAPPLPRSAIALSAVRQREPMPFESRALRPVAEAQMLVPGVAPPERRFHPREPKEWQGMLVDADAKPPCESIDGCGLARACKEGRCVACERDGDCAPTETCVLDHCVLKELATCRRSADCAGESVCILSGYTAKRRGNENMRSLCVDPASGTEHLETSDEPPRIDTRTSLPDDDLLKRAREAAKAK